MSSAAPSATKLQAVCIVADTILLSKVWLCVFSTTNSYIMLFLFDPFLKKRSLQILVLRNIWPYHMFPWRCGENYKIYGIFDNYIFTPGVVRKDDLKVKISKIVIGRHFFISGEAKISHNSFQCHILCLCILYKTCSRCYYYSHTFWHLLLGWFMPVQWHFSVSSLIHIHLLCILLHICLLFVLLAVLHQKLFQESPWSFLYFSLIVIHLIFILSQMSL